MNIAMFSADGLQHLFRLIHFFAGVVWIGMLYYFNFVQGEWFKEIDAAVKNQAVSKLVPRALAWFRYGALFTWLSGLGLLAVKYNNMELLTKTSGGIFILIGSVLGTIMFLNVWLVIWPNQKVVIASTNAVLGGGAANPAAAASAAKAGLASRHNVLFSIPLLFCMGAASHLPVSVNPEYSCGALVGILTLIIGGLEFNALKGKLGPLTTIKGVTHMSVLLTIVLYAVVEIIT